MSWRPWLYLAQVQDGRIEVYRDDSARTDSFDLPPGSNLRRVLLEHGWRPTGHSVGGRGRGAILVEHIRRG